MTLFWMRAEARDTEARAPLTPADAGELVRSGAQVVVESCPKRVFHTYPYAAAGCQIMPEGSWREAPPEAVILGLKELPQGGPLTHRHIQFAHLYKEQAGWRETLARYAEGGGALYDIEYLTRDGARVAAFGRWAGYAGAALGLWGLLSRRAGVPGPQGGVGAFETAAQMMAPIKELCDAPPSAVIIGALGRSGRGAAEALSACGVEPVLWDQAETADLDRAALLSHELMVNCVLVNGPGLMLARRDDLSSAPATAMIADVACDPLSDFNPLPVYERPTTWDRPFEHVCANARGEAVEIMAIDNLPSLLPREASTDFSAQLLPSLLSFPDGPEWQASAKAYETARARLE